LVLLLLGAGGLIAGLLYKSKQNAPVESSSLTSSLFDQLDASEFSTPNLANQPEEVVVVLSGDAPTQEATRRIAWSPDGRWLAANCGETISLWTGPDLREAAKLPGHPGIVSAIVFTPDSKILAVGGRYADGGPPGGWVYLWSLDEKRITGEPSLTNLMEVNALAFAPDGKTLAIGGKPVVTQGRSETGEEPARLQLWKKERYTLQKAANVETGGAAVRAIAFAPDGETLAAVCDDESVHLWNLGRAGLARRLLLIGAPILAAVLASLITLGRLREGPRYRLIVRLCAGLSGLGLVACVGLGLWTVFGDPLFQRATLPGELGERRALAYSPDSQTLATGKSTFSIQRWSLGSGVSKKRTHPVDYRTRISSITFAPQGSWLASGTSNRILVWDGTSEGQVQEYVFPDSVHSLAFANDGRHLAVALGNGTIPILRLGSRDGLQTILAECNEALARNPKDLKALLRRGQVRVRRGQHERALEDLSAVIAVDPKCKPAYWLRTLIHLRRGERISALENLGVVIQLDGQDALAFHQRGLLRAKAEDYVGAKSDLERAFLLDPKLADK
jgi:WD40 repeat protein